MPKKNRKSKNKRRIETTKKLLIINYMIISIIVLFTCYMTYKTNDLSAIGILIPSAFTEVGAVTSFYIWKAKCENMKKYKIDLDGVNENDI